MDGSRRSALPQRASVVVAICTVVLAAMAGQFLAGDDPTARLDELDTTSITLPFEAWIAVGLAYYVVIAVVLIRLLRRVPDSTVALVAVSGVIVGNEVWNALLFRTDSVAPAAVGMFAFAIVAVVADVLTFRIDRAAGWVLLPYVVWVVGYDVPWIVMVWRSSNG